MHKTETPEDVYRNKLEWLPDNLQQNIGHFNVFCIEDCIGPHAKPVVYSRQSFYKVSLMYGDSIIHYADKSLTLSGATLCFFNPRVPYTFEDLSEKRCGFFCIFTEAFLRERFRNGLEELPMFTLGARPVYALNEVQAQYIRELFLKMIEEINSDYAFKYELIRNYVAEMAYYALKTSPSDNFYKHHDAKSRITSVFTELLERQFPIETPSQRFNMRSANEFAKRLSVHVNHLNKAIRDTTGRTTTAHISDRIIREAKSLLRHTDWNVSEIGYSLGFDEPAHFNNFFKKKTQQTPSSYRKI